MATNDGSSRDGSGCAECARLRGRMESLLEHLRQELESPISSILGVAGLLQNSGLSGEQAEYLRVIRDAAEGMDLVRRSLGDMAWQDTQSALGGESDFDLRVLVHDLAELFRIHARRRNIHFKATVDDEVPSLVRGVPGILRRITGGFLNRVLGAPGGSTVSMTLGLAERGEGAATVRLEARVYALIDPPDAEFLDLCRDLAARHVGQRRFDLVAPLRHQAIHVAQRRGGHAQAHLARPRFGHGQLGQRVAVQRIERGSGKGLHGVCPDEVAAPA